MVNKYHMQKTMAPIPKDPDFYKPYPGVDPKEIVGRWKDEPPKKKPEKPRKDK
jgi:hypothetical protein